jgi:hypothetical protein
MVVHEDVVAVGRTVHRPCIFSVSTVLCATFTLYYLQFIEAFTSSFTTCRLNDFQCAMSLRGKGISMHDASQNVVVRMIYRATIHMQF